MKKIAEIGFDLVYLLLMLSCGVVLTLGGGDNPLRLLLGLMALVLGGGDLFHLLPRVKGLATGKPNDKALGIGTLVTSITATLYYLLLYAVWAVFFGRRLVQPVGAVLLALAALRVLLCCLPCNRWTTGGASTGWAVLRNLPFLAMGAVICWLFFSAGRRTPGNPFTLLPLAVVLSFGCYMAVVALADKKPAVGMLMMPKTLCYIWIQVMGILALG